MTAARMTFGQRQVSRSKAAIARRLPGYATVPEYAELERRHYGVKRGGS